jgi:predicted enzyme related to lactoylglutathione lyase
MNTSIIHFDIAGPDEERVRQFYVDVMGWTVNQKGRLRPLHHKQRPTRRDH